MALTHACPNCRCHPSHLTRWLTNHLIHTPENNWGPTTSEAYQAYLAWWFEQGKPDGSTISQNKLTRWLREQGIQINYRGARGNCLIGYTLRLIPTSLSLDNSADT